MINAFRNLTCSFNLINNQICSFCWFSFATPWSSKVINYDFGSSCRQKEGICFSQSYSAKFDSRSINFSKREDALGMLPMCIVTYDVYLKDSFYLHQLQSQWQPYHQIWWQVTTTFSKVCSGRPNLQSAETIVISIDNNPSLHANQKAEG